jgi:hypothetical protein
MVPVDMNLLRTTNRRHFDRLSKEKNLEEILELKIEE